MDQREKRILHMRAGMLILFLVSVLFLVIQIGTVSKNDRLRSNGQRDKFTVTDYHVASNATILRGQEKSKIWREHEIAQKLVAVPKGDEGPPHFKDGRYDNESKVNIARAKLRVDTLLKREKKSLETNEADEDMNILLRQTLPLEFQYLIELKQGNNLSTESTPLFWEIPLNGMMIRDVVATCLSATVASEGFDGVEINSDSELRVVKIENRNVVNVDVTTSKGIQRAKELDLVGSNISNIIITPLFFESLKLFDENHHGRVFTMMSHPILRAASLYAHNKEKHPDKFGDLTLEDYALSSFVENNWMVRCLCGIMNNGEVSIEHLKIAKEILRKKFIIGLQEYRADSLRRFEKFFGLESRNLPKKDQLQCRNKILKRYLELEIIDESHSAWKLLEKQNVLDLELFRYAKELYSIQGLVYFKDLEPYY